MAGKKNGAQCAPFFTSQVLLLAVFSSHVVQTLVSTHHTRHDVRPQRDTCNASVKEFQMKFKQPDLISRIKVWARRRWLNPNDTGFDVPKITKV